MTERLFRVIVIDPETRTIDVQVSPAKLPDIHALVRDKDGLDHFRLADHATSWDYAWVDDTGLARGEPVHAFKFSRRHEPIAGRCLILGVDKETRDTADAKFPLPALRLVVTFIGLIQPEVTWVEEPDGASAVVTYTSLGSSRR